MPPSITILPNEKELFVLISQDDQIAFTKIFDYYEPRIYPFVLKMTRSETTAEEIVQELFIKLWTNRASAANIENPRSYIFKMATNRTATYLKSMARKTRLIGKASVNLLEGTNDTEELIDMKEAEQMINKAVEQLPEQQKKVYLLSRRHGLNNDQIAEKLNISKNTVKNHLTAALHFIKEQLQGSPGTAIALIIFLLKNAR